MALLELTGVSHRFGGLVALENLDFTVDAGTIVAMIGPNGAGKSTVFNVITGIYRPNGAIRFDGELVAVLDQEPVGAVASIPVGSHPH